MARGTKDYGGVIDKPEIAIRPLAIYGSGSMLFYDDFESPSIKWGKSTGGNSEIGLTTTFPSAGDLCMYLKAGGAGLRSCDAQRQLGASPSGRIGLQCSWRIGEGLWNKWYIQAWVYTGTILKSFGAGYGPYSKKFYYIAAGGAATEMSSVTQVPYDTLYNWHTLKVVYDLSEDKYLYLITDGQTFDISTLEGRSSASSQKFYYNVRIFSLSLDDSEPMLYIDDVVVTQEP